MRKEIREIKAEVKKVNGQLEKITFIFVDKLPQPNDDVPGTVYKYGKATVCKPPTPRSEKNDFIYTQYSFYIVPILDKAGQYVDRTCLCTSRAKSEEMSPIVFQEMIRIARKYDNVDEFLDEAYASKIWENEYVTSRGRDKWLRNVYKAAHRTMKDITKETGMTQAKMAAILGIPKRSVENWCTGSTVPLDYMLILIQEVLGLVSRK